MLKFCFTFLLYYNLIEAGVLDTVDYDDPLDIYSRILRRRRERLLQLTCPVEDRFELEHNLIKRLCYTTIGFWKSLSRPDQLGISLKFDKNTLTAIEGFLNDNSERAVLLKLINILDGMSVYKSSNSSMRTIFNLLNQKIGEITTSIFMLKKTDFAIHFSYTLIFLMILFSALNIFFNCTPVTFLMILCVSQAVLVEWVNLYQKGLAYKASKYGKGPPITCERVNDLSYLQSISLWFSNAFIIKFDECHDYYSHILVDPITEISILEAASSAFRRFLGNYAIDIAGIVNSSLIKLLSNLPIQWQLMCFLSTIFLIIILILVLCGFELRSPLFGISFARSRKFLKTPHIDAYSEMRAIQAIRDTIREEVTKTLNQSTDFLVSQIVEGLNKSSEESVDFQHSSVLH